MRITLNKKIIPDAVYIDYGGSPTDGYVSVVRINGIEYKSTYYGRGNCSGRYNHDIYEFEKHGIRIDPNGCAR